MTFFEGRQQWFDLLIKLITIIMNEKERTAGGTLQKTLFSQLCLKVRGNLEKEYYKNVKLISA